MSITSEVLIGRLRKPGFHLQKLNLLVTTISMQPDSIKKELVEYTPLIILSYSRWINSNLTLRKFFILVGISKFTTIHFKKLLIFLI